MFAAIIVDNGKGMLLCCKLVYLFVHGGSSCCRHCTHKELSCGDDLIDIFHSCFDPNADPPKSFLGALRFHCGVIFLNHTCRIFLYLEVSQEICYSETRKHTTYQMHWSGETAVRRSSITPDWITSPKLPARHKKEKKTQTTVNGHSILSMLLSLITGASNSGEKIAPNKITLCSSHFVRQILSCFRERVKRKSKLTKYWVLITKANDAFCVHRAVAGLG